jgi:uncharacterized protein
MRRSFRFDLGKEDRILRGEVFLPDAGERLPVVIICHGFKGFKDWGFFPVLAGQLAECGFAAVTFNFTMNGVGDDLETISELDKFARNTFSREQEDLAFLLAKLKEGALPGAERMDTDRIGLLGHSRGGGNSILFALEHPEIRAVAVWNSIHRFDFFDPALIAEIREKGEGFVVNARTGQKLPIHREVIEDLEQNRERLDLLGRLPGLDCPLLIVEGDQDLPGFVEGAQKMAAAAPRATLHMITGGTHTFGAVHPFAGMTPQLEEAIRVTVSFFTETI